MKFERLIRSAPTGGFRWKVIGDGKLLESGTAETEMAARQAAEAAIKKHKDAGTQRA